MLKNMTKTQKIVGIVLLAVIIGTIIFVVYKRKQEKLAVSTEDEDKKDEKHLENGAAPGEIKYKVVKKEMHDTPKEEKVAPAPPQATQPNSAPKKGSKKVKEDAK